jgi:RNA polymerase sigma-70 factor (ECF subfamily)
MQTAAAAARRHLRFSRRFGNKSCGPVVGETPLTQSDEAVRREIVALLPRLRRLARAMAGQDGDDLVQICVERALMRLDQYDRGAHLDRWLFRILKNAWIDETRSRMRKARLFAPAEEGEKIGDDSAARMETRMEMADVAEAMAQLPDEQRLAVALVCVEGLSYREAADLLDVPVGTLTSRLARGRETLLARLGGAQ